MKRYGEWELKRAAKPDDVVYITIRFPREQREKFRCKVLGSTHDTHPPLHMRSGEEFASTTLAESLGWVKARVKELQKSGYTLAKLNGRAIDIHDADYSASRLTATPESQAA